VKVRRSFSSPQILIAAIALGQRHALAELYDGAVDRLYAIAHNILRSTSDAEEVICDTFQHIWSHAREYRADSGSVVDWLAITVCDLSLQRLIDGSLCPDFIGGKNRSADAIPSHCEGLSADDLQESLLCDIRANSRSSWVAIDHILS
jgi:Sigma-70 region 2